MIRNSCPAGDTAPGKRRGFRFGKDAGGALCFVVLGLLHLALISVADFPGRARAMELPRNKVMVFDLQPPAPPQLVAAEEPEPVPEQALQRSPPAPVPEPVPAPVPEPAPAEEKPPAELLPPPAPEPASVEGTPAGRRSGETRGAGFAGAAGATAAGRRPGMSEAEYAALIMRRLEEKKIYPLSMRKRGITGDVEALFTIRPDGSLGSLRAGDAPAHPFLAQAALETVRSAAPFPVMEGRAEDYSLRVTIRFQLE